MPQQFSIYRIPAIAFPVGGFLISGSGKVTKCHPIFNNDFEYNRLLFLRLTPDDIALLAILTPDDIAIEVNFALNEII
ncbi:hypothetical protein [Nostoc linckia]|uniref:hypothetical protein n=1 Tax=Nostoc linckia TaxID=92942 RepID=UPI000BFFACA1|nr:hypothetical protein [Nostoc linckia]PHJ58302.1 hypothetical protein VF03_35690 [Nostoc linckia z2]